MYKFFLWVAQQIKLLGCQKKGHFTAKSVNNAVLVLSKNDFRTERCCVLKGQLISKCLFEKIVWTKTPTKNLIDSAQQV